MTGNGLLIARNRSSALGVKYSSKRVTDLEEAQKWLMCSLMYECTEKEAEESGGKYVCVCGGC